MIVNILVIAIIGLTAYIWASRGVFSAFLHFVCTIVAGAIAFAVWEPLVYGVLLGVRDDIAWGVGLALPFAASLIALRLIVDKAIKTNLQFDDATNFVGGLVFGAASGAIATGILVLSIGFLRVPPNFMGYAPVVYSKDAPGQLVRGASLWAPTDRLVANFYGMTSTGALATPTPMAQRAPDVATQAGLVRSTFEGSGRTTASPSDFEVLGQYEVAGANLSELLTDSFSVDAQGNTLPQRVADLDGNAFPAGSTIVGYMLRFNAGAKEKQGQFIVGPGQVRLLARGPGGEVKPLVPIAFVNQSDPRTLDYKRWRFDGEGVYAVSAGAAAEAVFGFEFVLPPNHTPVDLQFRNLRAPLAGLQVTPRQNPALAFANPAARDQGLRTFALLDAVGVNVRGVELERDEEVVRVLVEEGRGGAGGVAVRELLPFNGQFNRSLRGGLDVDDRNRIFDGRATIPKSSFFEVGLLENLRVDSFARTPDSRIVQVDVGLQSRLSVLGRAFQTATGVVPPMLVDSLGRQYTAIGWVFDDGSNVDIRFTPGNPVRGVSELPTLSRARTDQRLMLIFRVNSNAEIRHFALGSKIIGDFDPPITVGR